MSKTLSSSTSTTSKISRIWPAFVRESSALTSSKTRGQSSLTMRRKARTSQVSTAWQAMVSLKRLLTATPTLMIVKSISNLHAQRTPHPLSSVTSSRWRIGLNTSTRMMTKKMEWNSSEKLEPLNHYFIQNYKTFKRLYMGLTGFWGFGVLGFWGLGFRV